MVVKDRDNSVGLAGLPTYHPTGHPPPRNSNNSRTSSATPADSTAIDWWMQAPFHAMGMMDPRLTQTGFGSYREVKSGWIMGAAVDVLRGNSLHGAADPVCFPGHAAIFPPLSFG